MRIPTTLFSYFIPFIDGLAPHSYFSTQKALSFIEGSSLSKMKKIADFGCGLGFQSVTLSEISGANIIALDDNELLIRNFKEELIIQKLNKSITPQLIDFEQLPFKEEELDMIWSESLISTFGFRNAINRWNKYVKKDGYIVVCAYCWLKDNPPPILRDFWYESGQEIDILSNRILQMEASGITPTAHFIMPEECWWNYYSPIDANIDAIIEKHQHNTELLMFKKELDYEIDLFEKYGDYYGYVFFIGERHRW